MPGLVRRGKLALILLAAGGVCLVIGVLAWFAIRSRVADVICAYGEASFQKGDVDKALADFTWAIRIDPKLAVAFSDRGLIWDLQGDYDRAIGDFDEAIRVDPKYAKAHNNRGFTWLRKGELDKALSDLNEAVRLDPWSATTIGNRGFAWFLKGDLDRAFADYNNGIRLDPKVAQNFDSRGSAWLIRGEYDKAIADFTEAVRLDPNRSTAFNNLAWVEATCPKSQYRDGKAAVQHATRACELNAWKRPNHLSTLAAAYAEAGDFPNAVKWMEKAIDLSPEGFRSALRPTVEQYKAHTPYREEGRNSKISVAQPRLSDFHFGQ